MQSDILDFLNGYLHARGQAGSGMSLAEDLAVVRYRERFGAAE